MKVLGFDLNYFKQELMKMETPEQRKKREMREACQEIIAKAEYERLKAELAELECQVDELIGNEDSKEEEMESSEEIKSTDTRGIDHIISDMKCDSRIDTVEMSEPLTNREKESVYDIKGTKTRITSKKNVITQYNPNNCAEVYSEEYQLSKTMMNLNAMQNSLSIRDYAKVRITRIDIATDLDVEFDEISKFLDCVHKCMRIKYDGKAWANVDENSLNDSSYFFKNRNSLALDFYNKMNESEGRSRTATRLEVRFTRVESRMINILKKWAETKRKNPKIQFGTFVYKYSKYIYTHKILQSLYSESGLKREYRSWLQSYRKKHSIKLYSKNQLEKFSKRIVRSIKTYMKC